ncbi:MAG: RNB domain-containing ribonuclease [Flaviflexus sp.]|nr:RNB domain-containing ribonuclease [Flaviflexus sp.]
MTRLVVAAYAAPRAVSDVLDALREEMEIAAEYPPEAAHDIAAVDESEFPDRRDIPFITIDPPGARDLDQAMHLSREGEGYLVRYAISAVGLFVPPGGPLDEETRHRGLTFYGPDGSIPLHPLSLSHGSASLRAGEDRPAYIWYLHLDAAGRLTHSWVEWGRVRSRAQLTYDDVQGALDGTGDLPGEVPADLPQLLADIGTRRLALERDRGGISLDLPEQRVVESESGYRLSYRANTDVDEWNAQISLLTGMAAADMMSLGGIGLLRTLPAAAEKDYARLRRVARALDLHWPEDVDYPTFVRSLDSANGSHAAFLTQATTLFRGASYAPLGVDMPGKKGARQAEEPLEHAAIAARYAHVTAPLRRLVDRFGLEVCRCLCAGEEIPGWVTAALPELPAIMARASQRASAYESAAINAIEALILQGREGEIFEAVVVDCTSGRRAKRVGNKGTVMLREPAVMATVTGENLPLGETVRVRLAKVTPAAVSFELVEDESVEDEAGEARAGHGR